MGMEQPKLVTDHFNLDSWNSSQLRFGSLLFHIIFFFFKWLQLLENIVDLKPSPVDLLPPCSVCATAAPTVAVQYGDSDSSSQVFVQPHHLAIVYLEEIWANYEALICMRN